LECAIHHRRGRLQLNGELADFSSTGWRRTSNCWNSRRKSQAATNFDLPEDFPGDPFDRVIAAAAKC